MFNNFCCLIIVKRSYQYYTNRHGELHSFDRILLQRNKFYIDWNYYYQYSFFYFTNSYALSNCTYENDVAICDRKCESVWFKMLNAEQEPSTTWAKLCDPIFLEKFGDISYISL